MFPCLFPSGLKTLHTNKKQNTMNILDQISILYKQGLAPMVIAQKMKLAKSSVDDCILIISKEYEKSTQDRINQAKYLEAKAYSMAEKDAINGIKRKETDEAIFIASTYCA